MTGLRPPAQTPLPLGHQVVPVVVLVDSRMVSNALSLSPHHSRATQLVLLPQLLPALASPLFPCVFISLKLLPFLLSRALLHLLTCLTWASAPTMLTSLVRAEREPRRVSKFSSEGPFEAAVAPPVAPGEVPRVNPLNQRPYSRRYATLYESRRKLPVWQYLDAVQDALEKNQVIVIEGETGSGKTTQVCDCQTEARVLTYFCVYSSASLSALPICLRSCCVCFAACLSFANAE